MALGTALSLFSGAGGLDLGLEAAGIETIGCIEIESVARRTLAANRPGWMTLDYDDVMEAGNRLTPRQVGLRRRGLDLIVGGPPCQPFSKAAQWNPNSRRGMEDGRAEPVHGLLNLVERFLPKAVLIENVVGYVQGPANARIVLEEGLAGINARNGTKYRFDIAILNAADFGVPQNRQRAILVARRDGRKFKFPEATHAEAPITAWDALHDLPALEWSPRPDAWTELLPCIPEGSNYLHLTARGGGPELFGWRTRYWSFLLKLARDRPSWTLPASPGPNTGPFHWDNRPLSVRERMRLQSFPDDWVFCGTDREQVRMSGNATPPALAEIIGRALVDQLSLGEASARCGLLATEPRLVRGRAGTPPAPVKPAALPAHFVGMVGEKASHPGTGRGPSARGRAAA
ncbi:Modification methylase HaeIII [Nocardia farcinica]|uniref:Cytosine-specific methyltransferase n=1 Tax=Nocardia farcinica TaxID=37329 RepID=A0A449H7B8_NOCFR|nr:Modification methylase HaeIII [Nocardia farcinica]